MKDKFFQLCNYQGCIKRILYKYFAEPDNFMTSNRDADSCCSYYNNSLCLEKPERIMYSERGVTFNIKKNYIFDKLKIWAQDLVTPKALSGFLMFSMYYTLTVSHAMLN